MPKGPPSPLRLAVALWLAAAATSCSDVSNGVPRIPSEPPGPVGNFRPIIHTLDGRHLLFATGGFQPSEIEHCREDGKRHLTTIYELARISPMGHSEPMCPELSGRVLRLYLVFPQGPALKVTTHCENGCVEPGGYYPPLGTDVHVPWSEIFYIEFRRD